MSSTRRLAIAVLVSLGLVATACSSSGSGGSPSGGTASSQGGGTTTGAAAESGDIKVGIICSCSGVYGAAFKAGQDAFEAWSNTINDAGGINGHKIKLLKQDDGLNPAKSAAAYKSLLSQKIVVLVDLTPLDATWISNVKTDDIPVLAGPTATINPLVFWSGQSSGGAFTADATIASLKLAGAKKFGMLNGTDSPQAIAGAKYTSAAAKKAGITIAYQTSISNAQPNYTAECIAAEQAGVDALTIGEQPSTIARAASDCDKQGFHPAYIGSLTSWSPANAESPGLKDNSYLTSTNYPYFDDTQPQIKALNAAMDKYFSGVRTAATTPAEVVVGMWASGIMLQKAIEAANVGTADVTSAKIIQGLRSFKDETLDGLSPPLNFPAGGDNTIKCFFVARFNGKYSIENGGKYTCAA